MADSNPDTANDKPAAITIKGRLGADPVRRETNSGIAVGNLSVAVREDGSSKTTWYRVVLWRENADYAVRHLHTGDMVEITGRLRTRWYTTKDGEERQVIELVAFENGLQAIRQSEQPSPEAGPDPELS